MLQLFPLDGSSQTQRQVEGKHHARRRARRQERNER